MRQLVAGVVRVSGAQVHHLGPNGRLAGLHRVVEGFQDGANLRWELF